MDRQTDPTTNKQRDRQIFVQTGRPTIIQRDGQVHVQTERQMDRQMDGHTNGQRETNVQTGRQIQKWSGSKKVRK